MRCSWCAVLLTRVNRCVRWRGRLERGADGKALNPRDTTAEALSSEQAASCSYGEYHTPDEVGCLSWHSVKHAKVGALLCQAAGVDRGTACMRQWVGAHEDVLSTERLLDGYLTCGAQKSCEEGVTSCSAHVSHPRAHSL